MPDPGKKINAKARKKAHEPEKKLREEITKETTQQKLL